LTQLAPFRLPEAPARTDLVAKYFRALGDPTRLRILALLGAEGELSAGELTRRLGLAQPKVSNHLACLRWCGFVEARREHRVVHYPPRRPARGGHAGAGRWAAGTQR
jgi:DNA-binding transcriptional ArsR family regulator